MEYPSVLMEIDLYSGSQKKKIEYYDYSRRSNLTNDIEQRCFPTGVIRAPRPQQSHTPVGVHTRALKSSMRHQIDGMPLQWWWQRRLRNRVAGLAALLDANSPMRRTTSPYCCTTIATTRTGGCASATRRRNCSHLEDFLWFFFFF